ncbi:hypothetical protein MRS44_008129 [Fusarium solani]|uniref:uncharacterized protein n=1 Tax=Fusarium solani TaxID=169388 RepID=UPI0032C485BB|nr:hypothetical protein MRS44_008129 [Fusarium solani]
MKPKADDEDIRCLQGREGDWALSMNRSVTLRTREHNQEIPNAERRERLSQSPFKSVHEAAKKRERSLAMHDNDAVLSTAIVIRPSTATFSRLHRTRPWIFIVSTASRYMSVLRVAPEVE